MAGHARELCRILTYEACSDFGVRPLWLKDSRRVLFSDGSKIYLADTVTKQVKEIYSTAPHQIQNMLLSSDNRSIGVALTISEADIWLATLRPQ